MKNILFLALVFISCITMSISSCEKDKGNKCPEDTMCTELFAMITANVVDKNNNPVYLTTYHTIYDGKEHIFLKSDLNDNNYTILDDSALDYIKNTTGEIVFEGYINGTKVVSETYLVGADCCHVFKTKGATTIVVK